MWIGQFIGSSKTMTQTILKRKAKENTVTLKWKNWITPGSRQHVRWDTSFAIPPSLSDYVLFISALIPGCKVAFWGLFWVTMNTVFGICWNEHPNMLDLWLVWCFFFFLFALLCCDPTCSLQTAAIVKAASMQTPWVMTRAFSSPYDVTSG